MLNPVILFKGTMQVRILCKSGVYNNSSKRRRERDFAPQVVFCKAGGLKGATQIGDSLGACRGQNVC